MSYNESFFNEAIALAESAKGQTGVNPFVGAVVVKDGVIVGRGCTQECGKNHAETEALLQAGEAAAGGELYVTLEPCCHLGKTPPCTDAIIEAGIKRVFAGITDPNPDVNGCGFKALEEAGIEVIRDIKKKEIEKLLEIYLTNRHKNRPFFIMKNAVSLDGKIACTSGASKWISSTQSREYVHKLRREIRVILTGIRTVLQDDPLLDVRLDDQHGINCQTKLRIVLDSNLRILPGSKIVRTCKDIPLLVVKGKDYHNPEKEEELQAKGVEIASVGYDQTGELSLSELVELLNQREIAAVIIEAGGVVNTSFLREKLIDKIYYFIAPKILGGNRTVVNDIGIENPSEGIILKRDKLLEMGDDILIIGYPTYCS